MRLLILFFTIAFSICSIFTQTKTIRNLSIQRDNDLFFFNDKYYSNGLSMAYEVAEQTNIVTTKFKFEFKNDIYSPSQSNTGQDRPYSSAMYLNVSKEAILLDNSFTFRGTLGYLGPVSLVDKVNTERFNLLEFYRPDSNQVQMTHDIIIGASFFYKHQFRISKMLLLIPEGVFQIGTYQAKIGGNALARLGRKAPTLYDLNAKEKTQKLNTFIDLKSGVYYRMFDASLQGGVFGNNQLFVSKRDVNPLILSHEITLNIQYSRILMTAGATFWNPELKQGNRHQFGSVKITYSF